MVEALIRWSLQNRITVVALAAAFMVWGGYTISEMPLDVLPDLTAPTVTVLVEAPGMAPTEIESLVTFPIESALNGASGVRRIRSATAVGIAVLWVEFDWGELAAGLALVPVALGMGKPGSEIQAPMAIVILFGLLSSTALNMVVVPAAVLRFGVRN